MIKHNNKRLLYVAILLIAAALLVLGYLLITKGDTKETTNTLPSDICQNIDTPEGVSCPKDIKK